jgi:hypothetical protein
MGLVPVLHVALIALLLRAGFAPHALDAAREMILQLAPPKPVEDRRPPVPPPPIPVPEVRLPSAQAPPARQAPPGVDLKSLENLGRALLDCRPENIANLPPEDRDRCNALSLKPRDGVDFTDHTNRSHDAALWARLRARKNGPALLPCMSNQGVGLGLGTLLCLSKGLSDGSSPRSSRSTATARKRSMFPTTATPIPCIPIRIIEMLVHML